MATIFHSSSFHKDDESNLNYIFCKIKTVYKCQITVLWLLYMKFGVLKVFTINTTLTNKVAKVILIKVTNISYKQTHIINS